MTTRKLIEVKPAAYIDADIFQEHAARTLIDAPDFTLTADEINLINRALCAMRELGGIVEQVKKRVYHRHLDTLPSPGAINESLTETLYYWAETNEMPEKGHIADMDNIMIHWNLIGLLGEACEAIDILSPDMNDTKAKKELGDVSWYTNALATKKGYQMSEIMALVINKLIERYPDGFSSEDSIKRVDVQEA